MLQTWCLSGVVGYRKSRPRSRQKIKFVGVCGRVRAIYPVGVINFREFVT